MNIYLFSINSADWTKAINYINNVYNNNNHRWLKNQWPNEVWNNIELLKKINDKKEKYYNMKFYEIGDNVRI